MGLVVARPAPAHAAIASLSPTTATVDPGGAATTTVRVQAAGLTCVAASPSSSRLVVDMEPKCSDAQNWSTQVTVSTPGDIDPGTYSVRITDGESGESGGRTFTLRVREPPPPPTTPPPTLPPPPTTIPPPPTTAAPPASTTTAPVTTAAPVTSPTPTTTEQLAPPPGGGFQGVATLVDAGVPAEGVFLPLLSPGYRDCLPLAEACVDPESGLVLIPARSTEVMWEPVTPEGRPAPRVDLRGLRPLAPVGVAPTDPGAQDYALAILDLTAPGGQVRTLVRGLNERGELVTPRGREALVAPSARGPKAEPEAATSLAAAPFGRPRLATKDELSEAAPAIALFSSTSLQVLYAVRPDPSWGLNVELLPLLGPASVPYLVRGLDGPPGLFVGRPAGLRVPQAGTIGDTTVADDGGDGGGGGGLSPVVLLGLAVAAGGAVTFVAARRRRQSQPEPET